MLRIDSKYYVVQIQILPSTVSTVKNQHKSTYYVSTVKPV
jgi:hypothetical protein